MTDPVLNAMRAERSKDPVLAAMRGEAVESREPTDKEVIAAAVDKAKILPTRIGELISSAFISDVEIPDGAAPIKDKGMRIATTKEQEQNLESTRKIQRAELKKAHPNVIGTKYEESGLFTAAEIGTEIFADPTTYIPIIGTSVKQATIGSALFSGFDNITRQKVESGEIDPIQAAAATALGGIFGLGVSKAGHAYAKRQAGKTVDKINNEASRLVANGVAPEEAGLRAARHYAVQTMSDVAKIEKKAGRDIEIPLTVTEAERVLTNTYESTRATTKLGKAFQAVTDKAKEKIFHPIGEYVEKAARGIHDRIYHISPEIGGLLRRFEATTMRVTNERLVAIQGYAKAYNSLSKTQQNQLDVVLANGEDFTQKQFDEAIDTITTGWKNADELKTEIGNVRAIMDDMFNKDVKQSGHTRKGGKPIGKVANFIPREVNPQTYKDIAKISPSAKGAIEKAFKRYAKEKGITRELTDKEKTRAVAKLMSSPEYKSGKGTGLPGHLKGRFAEVNIKNIDQYKSSPEALQSYIREVTHNSHKRQLFGLGSDETLKDSIAKYVATHKGLSEQDREEIQRLLSVRFGEGDRVANWANQDIKNIFYASTLGNMKNAVTQLGDVALSFYHNGFGPTMRALLRRYGNYQKADVAVNLGITRAAQELETMSGTTKALNWIFDKTGFNRIDRFGKQVIADAAYLKAQKMAKKNPELLAAKYKKMFLDDAEYQQFLDDLASGQNTELTKLFQFNEIAELQPISKSEMPEFYLKNPNLRMLYMLKTFTLKQMNRAYNDAVPKLRSPDLETRAEGVKQLTVWTAAMVASGAGPQAIKEALWNRGEISDPDDLIYYNLLKIVGLSKFNEGSFQGKPVETMMRSWMVPPVNVADDIISGDLEKKAKAMPWGDDVVGLLKWFQ